MNILNMLKNKALNLTNNPGVYLMKNSKETIIYIGKAKNLKNRVVSYFRNVSSHNEKIKKLIENVVDFDFVVTKSEFEALILECSLIKEYKPKYNILLKDSKGYKYIKISKEEFPKISISNKKNNDGAKYFGPYISSFSVKQVVEEINRIFLLPTCKNNFSKKNVIKRPCLNFYINRCMGLCKKNVTREYYIKIIEEAIKYIKQGDVLYLEKIKKQMEKAAQEQDFEYAIKLRDKIKSIEKIHETQKVFLNNMLEADVIAFANLEDEVCFTILKIKNGKIYDKEYFILKNETGLENLKEEFLSSYYYKKKYIAKNIILHFELLNLNLYKEYLNNQAQRRVVVKIPKKGVLKNLTEMAYENCKETLALKNRCIVKENKTLKKLQKVLNIKKTPNYIEAYDISNLGDSEIVGGMVVFKNGLPYKKNYRKFKIKTIAKRDDFSSMKEVLTRRIKRFKEGLDESFKIKPDLIFIDGGKSHVLTCKDVFKKENFDVPFFGIVKNEKHKTRAIYSSEGKEIDVISLTEIFLLLTKIQEEVHRFTITFQKSVHKKNSLKLNLTEIKGIGHNIANKILKYYSSLEQLKNSDVEEISKTIKISIKQAEKIKNYMEKM